jgi:CRP/FNR family cyclic AMP-dependent transcriptional regulator
MAFVSALFDQAGDVEPGAAALLGAAEVRRLRAGSSERGESFGEAALLIVEDGFVVIRTDDQARRRIVLCHAGRGALLSIPRHNDCVDALVDATLTLISEEVYAALLAHSDTATLLSDALRSTLLQQQCSIANFADGRPVDRVQRKLLQLAREHGRVVTDGVRLDFPVTHELLAEMIGTARETVSRAMDKLETSEFIVREGRSYRLRVKPETLSVP